MNLVARQMKGGGSALLGFFLIAALTALFFGEAVRGGYFYQGEISCLHLPVRLLTAQLLKEGSLPLWNRYISGGMPLLGEGSAGVSYPANFLFLFLFPPHLALKWLTILHYLLAGFFMFLLARELGAGFWGGLVAAAVFEFSGVAVTNLGESSLILVACWLPLILLFIEKGIKRGITWPFVLGGLVLGMTFLAGIHPYSVLILPVLSLFLLYRLLVVLGKGGGNVFGLVPRFLLLLILGFAVGAIQLLPYFEFQIFSWSLRGSLLGGGFPAALGPCMPAAATLFFPYLFGKPPLGTYLLEINYSDCCGYLGVFALFLILKAIASRKVQGRGFLGVILVLSFFASLVLPDLVFPGTTVASAWPRSSFLYIFTFAGALLAGLGVKATQGERRGRLGRRLLFLLFFFLLFLGGLYLNRAHIGGFLRDWAPRHWPLVRHPGELARHLLPSGVRFLVLGVAGSILLLFREKKILTAFWFGLLAFALILGDLFDFGAGYNPVARDRDLLESPRTARILSQRESASAGTGSSENKGLYRIYNFHPRFEKEARSKGWSNGRFDPLLIRLAQEEITYDTCIGYGIENIGDPGPVFTLGGGRLAELRSEDMASSEVVPQDSSSGEGDSGTWRELPRDPGEGAALREGERKKLLAGLSYLGAMNVKYVVSGEEIFAWSLEPVYGGGGEGPWIYENKEVKARAYVPREIVWGKGPREARQLLEEGKIDLGTQVIVEAGREQRRRQGRGKVSILAYRDKEVRLLARAERGSVLVVLADNYYPGWVARVDGKEKEILRVNGRLRGVWVEEGEHTIVFSYRPLSFYLGFWITLAGVALAILALIFGESGKSKTPRRRFELEIG